jgi:hypothetical protein
VAAAETAATRKVATTATRKVATTATRKMAATTTGRVPAATTAAVLGICQSRRTRYRNAEQQGSDDSYEMPCFVHCYHPVPTGPATLQRTRA